MDGRAWVRAFAEAIGVDAPDEDQVTDVLRLAADAAHASERWAAPVTCWLAARAGIGLPEALALAARLADSDER